MQSRVRKLFDKNSPKTIPTGAFPSPNLIQAQSRNPNGRNRMAEVNTKVLFRKRFVTFLCFLSILINGLPVQNFAQDASRSSATGAKPDDSQTVSQPERKRKDAITYLFLFKNIAELEKSGKADILSKKTGISPQSFENLKQKAVSLDKEIKKIDKKADAIIEEYRKQTPSTKISKDTKMPAPPQELFELQAEKDNTVLRYRDSLKGEVGEAEFAKLNGFVETKVSSKVSKKAADVGRPLNAEPDSGAVALRSPDCDVDCTPNCPDYPDCLGGGPTTSSPVGVLDGVDGNDRSVWGWSFDPDNSSASNDVHIYINGPAGSGTGYAITANGSRPDVDNAYGISGDHGYRFQIPTQFQDGQQHSVYAYGIDTGADSPTLLSNSPKYFNFPPPAPPPGQNEPNAYSYASVDYDDATQTVYGYSATEADYGVSLYYNPKVEATLKNSAGNSLSSGENTGSGTSASVLLTAPAQAEECDDFIITAIHTLIVIYVYVIQDDPNYFGWYDPYDFYYYSGNPLYGGGYNIFDPWSFAENRVISVQAFIIGFTEFLVQPTICADSYVASVDLHRIGNESGPIDDNPGNGVAGTNIGKRIFADKPLPDNTDTTNYARVRVRATISNPLSGKKIYFRSFDLDDPSANALPLDDESLPQDNKGSVSGKKEGVFNQMPGTTGFSYNNSTGVASVLTDTTGVAFVDLTITKQPGDNFAVVASTDSTYLSNVGINGVDLKNGTQTIPISTTTTPPASASNPAMRTEMLTVWRRVHIEYDRMANVSNDNNVAGFFAASGTIGTGPITVSVTPTLEEGRFARGRIVFGNNISLSVAGNGQNDVRVVNNTGQGIHVNANQTFTLYDDDDYNNDDGSALDGDSGEPINELPDIFYYLRPNDQNYADNTPQNVLRSAYIMPEYEWARNQNYDQPNVTFELNVNYTPANSAPADAVLTQHRDSTGKGNDDFWVAYFVLGYQGREISDFDGYKNIGGGLIQPESGDGGITTGPTCDCLNSPNCPSSNTCSIVPSGSNGSIIFQEVSRDIVNYYKFVVSSRDIAFLRVDAAHELGHQFGLKGDNPGTTFKIMGYPNYDGGVNSPDIGFHPEHLNILRRRVSSPVQ